MLTIILNLRAECFNLTDDLDGSVGCLLQCKMCVPISQNFPVRVQIPFLPAESTTCINRQFGLVLNMHDILDTTLSQMQLINLLECFIHYV